jgi:hypothetical protein
MFRVVGNDRFVQVLGLPAIHGSTESTIAEATAIRLRVIEELLVLISDFEEGVEENLYDWMVLHTDAGWWIGNHSISAIQISGLVGFAGLADLMMYETEAVQSGSDIDRGRYPHYRDDWDFLVDLGLQGRYATYIRDDNGYRFSDRARFICRLNAIHSTEQAAREEMSRFPELSLWTPAKSKEAGRWDRKWILLSTKAASR